LYRDSAKAASIWAQTLRVQAAEGERIRGTPRFPRYLAASTHLVIDGTRRASRSACGIVSIEARRSRRYLNAVVLAVAGDGAVRVSSLHDG
jgi:hypothetical protein